MVSSRDNDESLSPNSRKKKVQFNDDEPEVTVVEACTSEEKPALWYTHKDLKLIRSQCSCVCVNEDTKESACTCQNGKDERQRHHEFVHSLLRQQSEHKQLGVQDPRGLFQLSRACSKKSRQRALQVGRDQAKEVKSFAERRQDTIDIIGDALELLATGL